MSFTLDHFALSLLLSSQVKMPAFPHSQHSLTSTFNLSNIFFVLLDFFSDNWLCLSSRATLLLVLVGVQRNLDLLVLCHCVTLVFAILPTENLPGLGTFTTFAGAICRDSQKILS
jgi:hypothetical protein